VGPRELLICSVFRTTRMCTEQWCFASSTRAASKHICRRTSRRAGGTGVAWWSPGSGLVRVTGKVTGEVVPLPPNTTALSVPGLVVMRELGVCQHHSDFSVRTVQLKMALP
jgi:hypothetical protein